MLKVMPRTKSFQPEEALNQMMMVFWSKGYDSTSVADLELATGLNKRSLYNTFGNKEAIFEAALKRYLEMMGDMSNVLVQEPLGIHNIKAFFSSMRYEPHGRGCLLTKTANEKQLVGESTYCLVKNAIFGTEELLYRNLAADLGRKPKAKRLAKFLTSCIQGITTMAAVDPDPKRLKAVRDTIFATLDG